MSKITTILKGLFRDTSFIKKYAEEMRIGKKTVVCCGVEKETDCYQSEPKENKERLFYTLSGTAHCSGCGKLRGSGEVLTGVPCECGYIPKSLEKEIKERDYCGQPGDSGCCRPDTNSVQEDDGYPD